jgi:RNA polymerase sigma-70 factor (ECF subfamily)
VAKRLDIFEQYRPLLFSIAYRMLGSAMEAEDAVQEAYLRWQAVDPQEIREPRNFLATVVTRLCLNQLDRAREKREEYIGPWLPEPVPTEGDPAWVAPDGKRVEYESISMAFLVLLEKLNPEERAVFLLREVFQYPYPEIAGMIEKSEDVCRQIFHRAKVQLAANRPRFTASPQVHQRVFAAFLQAIQNGDLDRLKGLLVTDASLWADGGGRIKGAATRPVYGNEAVAQFLLASTRFAPGELAPQVEEINGQPAIVLRSDGQPFLVVQLELDGEKISVVRLFGNPQKLNALMKRVD